MVTKFGIKRLVSKDTLPRVAALVEEALLAQPQVASVGGVHVTTQAHGAYWRDHFAGNPDYKKWHISLHAEATVIDSTGEKVQVSFFLPIVLGEQGEFIEDRAREVVAREVEEKSRINFREFEFRYSIHADQIPAGFTVAVAPLGISSDTVDITVSNLAGEKVLTRSFPVPPKVIDRGIHPGGSVEVIHEGQSVPINTFIAWCARIALAEADGTAPLFGGEAEAAEDIYTPAQVELFNSSVNIMVEDFARHADLARSARV